MSLQEAVPTYIIELENLNMERHVLAAFRTAQWLAGEGEVTAAILLRAAVIVSRGDMTSDAFSHLATLLPLGNLPEAPVDEPVSEIRLSPELERDYPIAREYFSTTSVILGRDYITFALLADSDPTLNEIAMEAGTTADQLQDAWFEFVTSTDVHRSRDEWAGWWRAVGVPIPPERGSFTGSTYLFTWNPKRFPITTIESKAAEVANFGPSVMRWSSGNRKNLSRGDRVFLLRQGPEPSGLVGSGRIRGEAEQSPHWHPDERKEGKTSLLVPVLWDTLSTTPFITREELIQKTGEQELWKTRAGGRTIGVDLVRSIEELWPPKVPGGFITEAFRFAQTLSDLDHKNDWIGIRPDVEALSTLVAVNRVEPPLSIAIFGDWGSGKTFLMRKIQERVQLLEQIGKTQKDDATAEPTQTRYCGSILQIEFNAWHYTESNLWASLVNHIFEKLHAKLTPEDKGKQHALMVEKFLAQFEIARVAREAAEKQIEPIEAEVKLADNAVKEEQKKMGTATINLTEALGQSVWDYLNKELSQKKGQDSNLSDALKHFGFKESLDSAQTIYDTVKRFRSVSGRASEVFGSLLATRKGVYGAILVALVVFLATILASIYKIPILSIGTAFVGMLGWLAERAESARQPLDAIQSFDDWFSKLKQEEEKRIATALAEAQAVFEQRKEALSLARAQLAEAKVRETRAKTDLKQLTVRDQMRRFVDQRVTAQAYAKHLGIISMIRQDFEDLSDFMYRDRQQGEARLVKLISTEVQEAIPTIERIILYIDDLDRCQPERVVEVLEAIHLLLAFRLFIVVVAVDPRWVITSLRQRYPHLSQEPLSQRKAAPPLAQEGTDVEVNLEATAHDYLEKIFHIPFWVKPMSPEACKSLTAGYFNIKESAGEALDEEKQRESERFHGLVLEPSAQSSSIPDISLISSQEVDPGVITPTTPRHSEQTQARLSSERDAAERKIENVEITDREQEFIRKLSRYLGTSPRRIKRYANTYRLLKSGLTRQEARLFGAVEGSDEDYQVVLVFLAIVTGAPSLAPKIFSKAFALRVNFDVGILIRETGLDDESTATNEAINARGSLELLRGLKITKEEIETWVPRVMRYAFRLTPVSLVEK
jgi:hypothetical protein